MPSGMIGFVAETRVAPEKATIRTALSQHLNHGSQLSEVVMPSGIYPRKPITQRFWAKVQKTETCWNWIGAHTSKGYGSFWDGDKLVRAPRWSYEHFVGPIPKGLQIDHLCRNPGCVNPAHLEPVTQRENILRGVSFSAIHARKTHCKYGHRLTGSRVRILNINGRTERRCLICVDRRSRKHRNKVKARAKI